MRTRWSCVFEYLGIQDGPDVDVETEGEEHGVYSHIGALEYAGKGTYSRVGRMGVGVVAIDPEKPAWSVC
jgi:hypothetical protein